MGCPSTVTPISSSHSSTASRSGRSFPLGSCSPTPDHRCQRCSVGAVKLFTGRLYDVVLLCNGKLQCLEIMVLIDMDVLMEYIFTLTDQVKPFDCHGELRGLLSRRKMTGMGFRSEC